jgi:hypothetical protein
MHLTAEYRDSSLQYRLSAVLGLPEKSDNHAFSGGRELQGVPAM